MTVARGEGSPAAGALPSDRPAGSDASRAGSTISVALGAGVLGGIQPKINAVLAAGVGSPLVATLVNFTAAFVGVVAVLALRPGTRRRLRRMRSWPVPRWTFTAGLGGVLVVLSGAATVETLGVAVFSVAFFAGQIASGLLVDRLGVGAGQPRPVTAARLQSAGLALAAVGVSQIGRPVGPLAPALVLLVLAAGATSAFQAASNSRIAGAVDDAFAPTAVNVSVGLVALLVITGSAGVGGRIAPIAWPDAPWLYLGGLLGVAIVLAIAIASRAVGVLRATVAMLAAQLVTAFVVDAIVEGRAPTPGTIAGAALVVGAVARLGGRPPPSGTA